MPPLATIADKLDMSLDDILGNSGGSYGKISKTRGKVRSEPYSSGKGGSGGPGCRVFVGNLSYSTTWQNLKDHMRAAGDVVHSDIIAEPGTALGSKGCGLVEYSKPSEAAKAIRDLTETKLDGRPIFVREDREEDMPIAVAAHRGGSGFGVADGRGYSGKGSGKGPGGFDKGSGKGSKGSRSVFVGNLPYSATWKDLKDHFRRAGDVVFCDVIPEQGTTMGSKGCGLVEYATAADARRAIRELNESEMKGRPLFVRQDREDRDDRDDRPARRVFDAPRVKGARGGDSRGSCIVFVGNLPYSASWQDLKDHMREAGDVVHCDIMAAPGTAMGSKGCGLVEYSKPSEARRAIRELSESKLKGRLIFVREDRDA